MNKFPERKWLSNFSITESVTIEMDDKSQSQSQSQSQEEQFSVRKNEVNEYLDAILKQETKKNLETMTK